MLCGNYALNQQKTMKTNSNIVFLDCIIFSSAAEFLNNIITEKKCVVFWDKNDRSI